MTEERAFSIIDDGTLDTVIVCNSCHAGLRYNFNTEGWPQDCARKGSDDYNDFVKYMLKDAAETHKCTESTWKGIDPDEPKDSRAKYSCYQRGECSDCQWWNTECRNTSETRSHSAALSSRGTYSTGAGSHVPYRATFANGIKLVQSDTGVRVTSPTAADFEIRIYARDDDDAERFAEHYARDYVTPLVALARIQ